ncbi:MAG: GNAT family N-acetyltransferase [Trueperaceae bacterium]
MSPGARPLRPDDVDAWMRIRQASYGQPRDLHDPAARRTLEARVGISRGVDDDGDLAAVATWYPYRFWIGGTEVPVGALAGVATAPWVRRRGHVRTLVREGLQELHEAGTGWALEHPFDPAFYGAMGFRTVPAGVTVRLPLSDWPGRRALPEFGPVPLDDPELRRDRASFASRHNFALQRDGIATDGPDRPDPRWLRLSEPPSDDATPPVAYRANDGYAVIATEGYGPDGTVHVLDAAWRDARARERVLALPNAWRGQVGWIRIDLPSHDPVALDLAGRYAHPRTLLQARIADLPGALRPLRAPSNRLARSGVMDVHDPFAPWIHGRWEVALTTDGCEVRPTDRSEDLTVTASALAAALAGVPVAPLLHAGEAEGDADLLRALASTTADQPEFLGTIDFF